MRAPQGEMGAPLRTAVVFGTRPEAIKLAPVVLALRSDPRFAAHVCVTAQHRRMLDQVLDVFGVAPDTDLDLMRPDQGLAEFAASALVALDGWMARARPELVLVQGDTTTVFATALAAFYHGVAVGHVEAGLRTGNLRSPWPEEANRVLTSRLAALHFAPTERARANLLREGVAEGSVHVTGNTVVDALLLALARVRRDPPEVPGLPDAVARGALPGRRLVLVTGHRRESFGPGFESLCRALAELARRFPEVDFVYPVHLNPNVREPVLRLLGKERSGLANVHLLEPLAYLPFVALMEKATLLLTDSGGVQEEAPTLRKPVLVTRDTTERPEALAAGSARLVGTGFDAIVGEVSRLLTDRQAYEKMAAAENPFGDGRATGRILAACLARFRPEEPA